MASLPVELSITSNAVIIHKFIDTLKLYDINNINVSLDTLIKKKFKKITLRDHFEIVYINILLLVKEGFNVKINAVLIRGVNDDEIIDFIKLTKDLPVSIRFIEFMPFDGNKWDMSKMVSYEEVMTYVNASFSEADIERLQDAPNNTPKNYKIKGYK